MTYVIDTNAVVSAALNPSSRPGEVVLLALRGGIECVVSTELLEEYREVLSRPKLPFSAGQIDALVAGLASVCRLVSPQAQSVFLSPDPCDQFVIDLACEAQAAIVTGNTRHFEAYPAVLSPSQLLESR